MHTNALATTCLSFNAGLTNEIASRLEEIDELARAGSDASRTISSARRRLKRLYAIADKLDAALENGPENHEL
jgi:hypothetical protein